MSSAAIKIAQDISSRMRLGTGLRDSAFQGYRSAGSKQGGLVTRRMRTTALLKRKKGASIDWMDSDREVLVTMPIGEEITKRQLEVTFMPKRVTVKMNGQEFIAGELDAEIDLEECTWSIDTDENDQRQVQLVLAKKEYWDIWPFLFHDEAEGMDEVTETTWMDIEIDGEPQGRITFGLFGKAVPQTAENFMMLCVSTLGTSPESGKELTYKGNVFHRIIPGFMIQGGDITQGDGTGGESIYDGGNFDDENFLLKHTERGMLSMANAGPNTNNSQFFITTVPCPHLDGKHVVFGKVLSGMEIVEKMEACGSGSGIPTKQVVIADCGEIYTEPQGDPDDISDLLPPVNI